MIMDVLRLDGALINIGPWDGRPTERQIVEGLTSAEEPREDGSYALVWRDAGAQEVGVGDYGLQLVPTNLIPARAVWSQEEVVRGPDGGLYVVGDPRLAAP